MHSWNRMRAPFLGVIVLLLFSAFVILSAHELARVAQETASKFWMSNAQNFLWKEKAPHLGSEYLAELCLPFIFVFSALFFAFQILVSRCFEKSLRARWLQKTFLCILAAQTCILLILAAGPIRRAVTIYGSHALSTSTLKEQNVTLNTKASAILLANKGTLERLDILKKETVIHSLSPSLSHSHAASFKDFPTWRILTFPLNGGDLTVRAYVGVSFFVGVLGRIFLILSVLWLAIYFISGLIFALFSAYDAPDAESRDESTSQNAFTSAHAINDNIPPQSLVRISLIRVVYFLTVFMEGTGSSFLSPYAQNLALQSGYDTKAAASSFTAYFLAFTLALIPAARLNDTRGSRAVLLFALLMQCVAFVGLALSDSFPAFFIFRAIAGAGSGMLLVGIQSSLIASVSEQFRTRALATIVYGYNAGMIAGTTLGSHFAGHFGNRTVFEIATVVGIFLIPYVWFLLPNNTTVEQNKAQLGGETLYQRVVQLALNMKSLFQDKEFLRASLLVGVVSRIALAGAIVFGVPLLLSKQGFSHEQIGQMLIFYSGGVLISSHFASALADKSGDIKLVLTFGSLLAGAALIILGWSNWIGQKHPALFWESLILFILGLTFLGLAHGCTHAPTITFVSKVEAATRLGTSVATSTYRIVERLGHVSGPLIMGLLFQGTQTSPLSLCALGLGTLCCAFLFLIRSKGLQSDLTKQTLQNKNNAPASRPLTSQDRP